MGLPGSEERRRRGEDGLIAPARGRPLLVSLSPRLPLLAGPELSGADLFLTRSRPPQTRDATTDDASRHPRASPDRARTRSRRPPASPSTHERASRHSRTSPDRARTRSRRPQTSVSLPVFTLMGPPCFQGHGTRGSRSYRAQHERSRGRVSRPRRRAAARRRAPRQRRFRKAGFLSAGELGGGSSSRTLGLSLAR